MAYPTTGILDNFNRSDGSVGANYSAWDGQADFSIASNQVTTTSGWHARYWNPSTFGADTECYATITTFSSGFFIIFARGSTPASINGYGVQVNGTTITLYGYANGSGGQIGSWTQTVSSGDSIGLWCHGTTIYAYYKSGSNAWTELGHVTDSAWQSAGYNAIETGGTVFSFDNFGGGTEVVNTIIRADYSRLPKRVYRMDRA